MAGELDSQITSEAVRTLDQDHPHAIAGDPLQHGEKAGALGHGIGAAHGGIIELGLDLIPFARANPSTAARCRRSLSLSAPELAAELVRRYTIAGVFWPDFMQ
jgi:hypothetical protein